MLGLTNFALCDRLRNPFCRYFGKDSGWTCLACATATYHMMRLAYGELIFAMLLLFLHPSSKRTYQASLLPTVFEIRNKKNDSHVPNYLLKNVLKNPLVLYCSYGLKLSPPIFYRPVIERRAKSQVNLIKNRFRNRFSHST